MISFPSAEGRKDWELLTPSLALWALGAMVNVVESL